MWLRIENDTVVERIEKDPSGMFHSALVFIQGPDNVGVGWKYNVVDGVAHFYEPMANEGSQAEASLSCSPAQGLVALFALRGITEDDVLSAIDQIPDPVSRYTARIGYQRSTVWESTSPSFAMIAQLLQLADEDIPPLFAYANSVKV